MYHKLAPSSVALGICFALSCAGNQPPAATQPTPPVATEPAPVAKATPPAEPVAPEPIAEPQLQTTRAEFAADSDSPVKVAMTTIRRTKGNKEVGTLRFEQRGDWVTMSGSFTNLPRGPRGLQIHTNADCGGKGASKSGPDFNPTDAKHGPPESPERHVGDFGNLMVDKDGTAQFEMKTDSLTVAAGPVSVVGRTIVITARKDDGKTQPSGNAGPAIACGVIRAK